MSRVYGLKMVEKHTVTEVRCDGCGKVVRDEQDDWVDFSSYHSDWGNDSIDSHDQWDACSAACYLKIVRKVLDDYGETTHPTLTVDGKSYAFARDMLKVLDA